MRCPWEYRGAKASMAAPSIRFSLNPEHVFSETQQIKNMKGEKNVLGK